MYKYLLIILTVCFPFSFSLQEGSTPLHRAAYWGHHKVCSLLIEKKAKLTVLNNKGSSALHDAAMQGYITVVEVLLDAGVPLDLLNNKNQNALHRAAEKGHIMVIEKLIKRGLSVQHADRVRIVFRRFRPSLFNFCIIYQCLLCAACVKQSSTPCIYTLFTILLQNQQTALHLASGKGSIEAVQLLIESGADLNAVDEVRPCDRPFFIPFSPRVSTGYLFIHY
jgi:ankyrin repeat protein